MKPSKPVLTGTFGMVASTHWLASGAAMSMLERGGNAYDAAVAAGFVLQVVEPHLNGLGGEVPILHWSASSGAVEVVCGQGPVPERASIAAFRDLGLPVVPGTGLLPACVPGAFAAWTMLLERHGTMELAEVLEPAITHAEHGILVTSQLRDTIASAERLMREEWVTSAPTWLPGGQLPVAGSLHTRTALARTYRRLVAAGTGATTREARIARSRDAFYRGFVAEAIGRFCRDTAAIDTSGQRHTGLLSADDLARFEATVEPAISFTYHGKEVHKPATWTQGLVLLQQLAILAQTEVHALPRNSSEFIHLVAEAAKLAFADREAWYGDPSFFDVPVAGLLDPAYNAARAALISGEASFELRPGSPDGRSPRIADEVEVHVSAEGGTGEPTQATRAGGDLPPHGDTVHLDILDQWGNMVSATPSGAWFQSSPEIPELGFCLGTRGQMFWLQEGLPSSLAPGKRPRSTLTPSLVTDDDGPWLAFGTPGGDNQDQWSLNFLLTLLHDQPDLQYAIDAPTFYTQHFPSSFFPRSRQLGRLHIEGHADQDVIEGLRARGHDVVVDPPWSQGWVSAVGYDRTNGLLRGAANSRGRQGYAIGR